MTSKISLGTAQFGMDYGIANDKGKPSLDKVKSILKKAKNLGVKNIDTASVYGASESILGQIGVSDFNLTTKIPSIPIESVDIIAYVNNIIEESLNKIKIKEFHGVLLHDSEQLFNKEVESDIHNALISLKDNGLTKKVGISIYDPNKLSQLNSIESYDIVQCPYNLFDRRLESSNWMEKLNDYGIEIQIRSIFLQGLLLMEKHKRPTKFKKWNDLWDDLDNWLKKNNISAVDACLNFSFESKYIDSVVLGVDSEEQLNEIFNKINNENKAYPKNIFSNDINLINPVNWSSL